MKGFWISTDALLTFICQNEAGNAEMFNVTEDDVAMDWFVRRIVEAPDSGEPLSVLRTEIAAGVMRLALDNGLTPIAVFPYRDPSPPIGETHPLFRDMRFAMRA